MNRAHHNNSTLIDGLNTGIFMKLLISSPIQFFYFVFQFLMFLMLTHLLIVDNLINFLIPDLLYFFHSLLFDNLYFILTSDFPFLWLDFCEGLELLCGCEFTVYRDQLLKIVIPNILYLLSF